jgi:hypothetical protein
MSARTNGMVGVFAHTDALMDALHAAKDAGVEIREVYSPVPFEEAVDFVRTKRSPIRFFTLVGALGGLASGLGLALYTSLIWNIIVAGKPVASIIPFMVIGFELTILFGGIFTLIGVLLLSGLPFRRFPEAGYRPVFSDDRFGLWLTPKDADRDRAREILEAAGAESVEEVAS